MNDLVLTREPMYPERVDVAGRHQHARQCKAAFGSIDPRCHRCLELLHGRSPRSGWRPARNQAQRRLF
jgi:hypothetical protein